MNDVPEKMRVFICRFIDEIKGVGQMMRKKPRLVTQNYGKPFYGIPDSDPHW